MQRVFKADISASTDLDLERLAFMPSTWTETTVPTERDRVPQEARDALDEGGGGAVSLTGHNYRRGAQYDRGDRRYDRPRGNGCA